MAPNLTVTVLRMGRRSILPPTQSYGSCLHHHQLTVYYCFSEDCSKAAEVTGWDTSLFLAIWGKVGMSVLLGRETEALWIAYEALVRGSVETQVCPNDKKQNIKSLHLVNTDVPL